MATTAGTARASTPTSRQRLTSASPTSPPSIARGATARSAVSRTPSSLSSSAASRRASVKITPGASPQETREALTASLKHETEQKEQLLVQIQNKEQTIASLTEDNGNLTSALSAAENRVNELYAEQARSETDLAQRIEVAEKLRAQVRELEKEKRDIQRRYNEQTATFEAERQAFYDNEQHLKSRIQSLTQQLKQREEALPPVEETTLTTEDEDPEPEHEVREDNLEKQLKTPVGQHFHDPEDEPAEMTALKLELSTLSTSYSSMQTTLGLLQTQLVDLKRVNREVQEENESYMILLQEKTLSGQFNLMRQVGQPASDEDGDEDEDDSENIDSRSMHSSARSTLDPVDELAEESFEDQIAVSHHSSRSGRRRAASSTSSVPRGETLADLPISGPGLDLAAELGRAENKDMLGFDAFEDRNPAPNGKNKRSRKASDTRKVSSNESRPLETSDSVNFNDLDALRNEVKSLKDANKALSLYASKIIDRIISQEGFEHVLAVDYEKQPSPTVSKSTAKSPTSNNNQATIRARPQSVIVERTASAPVSEPKKAMSPPMPAPSLSQPTSKANRRSMSFDWRGFSLFSPTTEKKPDPNLRPLTLQPGASPVTGAARKLDTQEDEDDRKERERLNATMKLMGIEPSQQPAHSPSIPPSIPTAIQRTPSTEGAPLAAQNRRFSFWGFKNTSSDTASVNSKSSADGQPTGLGITPGLTQEALEQAEAQNSLAALDAHERSLSAELARGGSSGFTEISPRMTGRRSRRSAGGSSGSTVWSAAPSTSVEMADNAPPKPDVNSLPGETLDFANKMFDAARNGSSELLLAAVDAGLPANLTNAKGNTLLMLAAYAGHKDLSEALLKRGADPNRLNDLGQSIIAGAVFKGYDEVVKLLAANGADPRSGTPSAVQTAHMFHKKELFDVLGTKEGDAEVEIPKPPTIPI